MRSQSTEQEKSQHSQTRLICDRGCILVNSFFLKNHCDNLPHVTISPGLPYPKTSLLVEHPQYIYIISWLFTHIMMRCFAPYVRVCRYKWEYMRCFYTLYVCGAFLAKWKFAAVILTIFNAFWIHTFRFKIKSFEVIFTKFFNIYIWSIPRQIDQAETLTIIFSFFFIQVL